MEVSDQELAKLLNKGSTDAFRTLYNRYGRRIYLFAFGYLKSDADAEELLQDVFLKLWEKRSLLDDQRNLKAYLFKIAVNAIYDFIRRKNIERAFIDFNASPKSFSDETWQDVVYNDMLSQIEGLMQRMPEQRRRIFKLSKVEGLSNDEIAIKLGLSKRTIENQLYRATVFLKENLVLDSALATIFFFLFC